MSAYVGRLFFAGETHLHKILQLGSAHQPSFLTESLSFVLTFPFTLSSSAEEGLPRRRELQSIG